MGKRWIIATSAAGIATLALATAAAGQGTEQFSFPVSATLTSPPCADLPPGTTVELTGTAHLIVHASVDAIGQVHLEVQTNIHGTASDNLSNTYVFNYHQGFNLTFSSLPAEGRITDHFNLVGNGPGSKVHTFFNIEIRVLSLDPFDFEVIGGTAHGDSLTCDPL